MKLRKMVSLILVCILLSGCWDKIEIDRKSLVSIMGIDVGEEIGKEKELKSLKPDEPYTAMDVKKIHVTFGAPDISKLGPDKGSSAEDIYLMADGYSMQDAISKVSLQTSRDIKFSHTKLLVLSKDLMTYPDVAKEVVDYLQREPSLNRMMYVVLADGKAEEYLKYKPGMEKNIEGFLTGLIENSSRSDTIFPITLNEFLVLLSQNGNAMLPVMTIEKDKNELRIAGVGMIKNYKIIGNLSPVETSNLVMLRGKLRGGRRVTYLNGHPVDISIDGVDRKISVQDTGGKLIFNIDLRIEGEVKDYHTDGSIFSKDTLSYIQDNFNKSIKKECERVVRITQQEFEVDPIGLREYVEKFHPSIWRKRKNSWGESYKNAVVNVNVNTNVRRIGVVK
ncbi:Ger(x)C family spore germination protein [Clostridium sp. A1-XYC3]|uniref:Ger(X)C family spore germination protein n=1 Tax=Clostridium tanneri TaxID=3037988 RepID=A0ABU4JR65_9CLOT|nr:Ger(x)C family spore germination protein [Clostridium sp. A1-XYC3]MDW8800634.1 Ger(x)C family spore germination protein [Clostridium sp. A1-XYC3]